jgi:DNA-binding transcriptional MerR regulator
LHEELQPAALHAALAHPPPSGHNTGVSGIRTHAAAALLNVSPNTLRSWERRYGFPRPHRSAGGHRQYALADVEALRGALAETQNISSAVAVARQRGEGPSSAARLAAALCAFDETRAARLLEESLALRSVERTIEEVLLDAVGQLMGEPQAGAEADFAWRHATGWLAAMARLSPPASRSESLLILETAAPYSLDALHTQALELMLRRAGLRAVCLSAAVDPVRLTRAVRAISPAALILAGQGTSLDAIARLVYSARNVVPSAEVLDFRCAVPDSGASAVLRLGSSPLQARELLLECLLGRVAGGPPALVRAAGTRPA